jgi:hypothetical protein
VEHLKSSLMGQAFALPTNIRLGWKVLTETKALAYHECSYIRAVSDLGNTFSIEKIYKFLKIPLPAVATQYLLFKRLCKHHLTFYSLGCRLAESYGAHFPLDQSGKERRTDEALDTNSTPCPFPDWKSSS